ncbi:hypothetical protein [Kitasatospora sp. NPDC051914]|uniref:hypothetical protein n=1 Tax=Kitasatospora sp. NPDC051914 TaxID=3154945 RepID=UPI00342816A2
MRIVVRVYFAAAAAIVIGIGLAALPDIMESGCPQARKAADSKEFRALASLHPEGATPVKEWAVSCNHDGGFADAQVDYGYPLAGGKVVEFYSDAAQRLGWQPGREGEQGDPTVGGFCFSRTIDGVPVMARIGFDSQTKIYSVVSEVALDGSRIRCWL